jgi:hypothetical protein
MYTCQCALPCVSVCSSCQVICRFIVSPLVRSSLCLAAHLSVCAIVDMCLFRQRPVCPLLRLSICPTVTLVWTPIHLCEALQVCLTHRNLRSRTSILAQVLEIFLGKEHLAKNRLISTLDKVIYFKGTIFLWS